MRYAALLVLLIACQLPWLDRPVHYDEANFLTLAHGAALDPWRPHDVSINWQGTEERAFAVLSNPPGIAWWLMAADGQPVWVQRLCMLPWLAVALAGALKLGRRFWGQPTVGALALTTAPIALLSSSALLPDLPLYALTLLGVGGYVEAEDEGRASWAWALIAGGAALFRYSALTLPLVLGAYSVLGGRRPWAALVGWAPLGLLALHDLHAYGAVHLVAMGSFQSVSNTGLDWYHKGIAALTMLGGAAALPLLPWGLRQGGGAVLGGALGLPWGAQGVIFGALGGASFASLIPNGRGKDAGWLLLWGLGGFLFLLSLRFTATRYWLPFLPPFLLALGARWAWARVGVGLGLGLALAADDAASARAQEELADQVAKLGTGGFTGHWGWQWAMEARGWRPLDEGSTPALGTMVAIPREAWPQHLEAECFDVVWKGKAKPPYPWLPRGYTSQGQASLHANWVAGDPPKRTVAPWWFASDPYEQVKVCK